MSGAESAPGPVSELTSWRWALAITLLLTLLRLLVVRYSPLQLYPDEAQYWVWSRTLAFGYFSKPPMIAWLIGATTALFGDAEAFVRLSSPLLHGAAGLVLYAAGRRLYDKATALVGLLIYALMPAVQLGAFVASTDTPLCAFLAAALWLYVVAQQSNGRRQVIAAAGLGLALGLAFLSKYAALYAIIGIALDLAAAGEARRAWRLDAAAAAVLAFAVAAGPNIAWNMGHGFATVAHTADNAGWAGRRLFNIGELLEFLGAQFGVFGPVPFAVLVGGAATLAVRRRLQPADLLLLCWTLPPLVIITAEAFIAHAHANWAVAAYAPGSILAAAWLVRWRARRLTTAALIGQAVVTAVLLVGLAQPRFADSAGLGNALKRLRGWREMTEQLVEQGQLAAMAGPLTAAAVDDRFLFNEAAYYGRDYFGRAGPPLRAWTGEGPAQDEAERASPLTVAQGGRVLVGCIEGFRTRAIMARFARTGDLAITQVRLDNRHSRRLDIFVGEGLGPARPASAPPP
jgi:4-amino-4-deoxy-L-arabinose transferase-like glycosyltransferase